MGQRKIRADKLQAACDQFNALHKVGDTIDVWPGLIGGQPHDKRGGKPATVEIVEPGAHILGGHTAVVQVSGGHGCISLTHVAAKP